MQTHLDTRAETPLRALLLLGPTGVGKSPLGDRLEAKGLAGVPCHHLDFGAQLRAAAAGRIELPRMWRRTVIDALEAGRLLEDDEFPAAEAIFDAFLARRQPEGSAWIVLNGIPRHEGQVEPVAAHFDVRHVVQLVASPQVILDRIHHDVAGDRAGRDDDDPARVLARLERFEARTRPLLHRYVARGVALHALPVLRGTSAEALRRGLEAGISG